MSLQIYDLTHTYGQFMPEWPSHPGVDIDVLKFHARDGVYEVNWRVSCTAVPTWTPHCM